MGYSHQMVYKKRIFSVFFFFSGLVSIRSGVLWQEANPTVCLYEDFNKASVTQTVRSSVSKHGSLNVRWRISVCWTARLCVCVFPLQMKTTYLYIVEVSKESFLPQASAPPLLLFQFPFSPQTFRSFLSLFLHSSLCLLLNMIFHALKCLFLPVDYDDT